MKKLLIAAALGLFAAGCRFHDEAAFEAKRQAMLDRIGPFIYNTDGCEMFYYPGNQPITKEAFWSLRHDHAKGTAIRTVSYCPLSSGFGFFVVPGVGEFNTRSYECKSDIHHVYPRGAKDVRHYNAATEFARLGTDAVQMSIDWCRTNGCQSFVSLRFNDTHDQSAEYGHVFFPPFKAEHPDWLMGRKDARPKVCSWTAVDFGRPYVRGRMRTFVRQFFEKYDMDGFEIDYFRHCQIFKSVADGGVASEQECAWLTDVMDYVRTTAEEFGRKRGHPILIAIRTPDSVGYCRAVGIDLKTWFERKLVDVWTSTGYFQHEQWPTTVAFAHKYGIRCYASMDESRIPGAARSGKCPIIDGRETKAHYRARFAAAFAAGCDGANLFNLEYARLTDIAKEAPRDLVGLSKLYFATDRGSGGYRPTSWLVDGDRFNRMPTLDPCRPHELKPNEAYAFEMMLGEDFEAAAAKGLKALVEVLALPDAATSVRVSLNGHPLTLTKKEGDVLNFKVNPDSVKKGLNAFSAVSAEKNHLRDFAVRVTYR